MRTEPYKCPKDGRWKEADGSNYKIIKGRRAPWLEGKGFEANTQNINKKGPRKSIGSIIDDMKKADEAGDGVTVLDKRTLMELYKILFNTPANELNKLAKRDDTPLGVAIIIDTLLDKSTRARAWHDYQQYVYGKAPEQVQVTTNTTVTKEEEDAILRVVGNKY